MYTAIKELKKDLPNLNDPTSKNLSFQDTGFFLHNPQIISTSYTVSGSSFKEMNVIFCNSYIHSDSECKTWLEKRLINKPKQ